MREYKIKFSPLPTQQKIFDDETTQTLMFSGGLGCMAKGTLIHTIDGLVPIEDIRSGTFCFSKNDLGQFCVSPSSGSYLKGRDYLYRVKHERGEFVASGQHLVFLNNHKYQQVQSLFDGYCKKNYSLPCLTILEHVPSVSLLDDGHLSEKCEGFLYHCLNDIHLYDQLLLSYRDISQGEVPSHDDVLKFYHSFYSQLFEHWDAHDQQVLERIHPDLLFFHKQMKGYLDLLPIVSALANQDSDVYQRHVSLMLQSFSRLLQSLISGHLQQGLFSQYLSFPCYSPFIDSKVISVERLDVNDFYDLHVFGTNNYISSDGGVHHNSGKTYLLCMKLLKLSVVNNAHSGGVLAPTYSDFRRDIKPTFVEILEDNGIPYKYHGAEHYFSFPWQKKNAFLYVYSADRPISGVNLGWGGINEMSLISWERINEFIRRVRIKETPHPQKILVGTPEDTFGWLPDYVDAQLKLGEDAFKIYHASTEENTHISADYINVLRSMMDEQTLKVFLSGQIVKLGGKYFYYSFKQEVNVSNIAQFNPSLPIHCGLDFNVGKMACHFGHKLDRFYHIFDELFLRGESNTYTMADAIKEKYPDHWQSMIITCDASGNARKSAALEHAISDVQILRKKGFTVRFKTVNPRLRKRQILVNGKLEHGEILVNPKCRYVIKDFNACLQKDDYTKDEGKEGLNSHMSDGIDYVVDYEFKVETDKSKYIITCE